MATNIESLNYRKLAQLDIINVLKAGNKPETVLCLLQQHTTVPQPLAAIDQDLFSFYIEY